jgi:hypothetical protein
MNNESSRPERQLLEELLAEKAELERHIAFLQKRLNMPPSTGTATPSSSESASPIEKGGFFGLSRPQAAAALLKKVRQNLTTNEIFEKLRETGYEGLSGKNAFNGLYTALSRSSEVTKVAPNTWGLRARYPHLKDARKRGLNGDQLKALPLEPGDFE